MATIKAAANPKKEEGKRVLLAGTIVAVATILISSLDAGLNSFYEIIDATFFAGSPFGGLWFTAAIAWFALGCIVGVIAKYLLGNGHKHVFWVTIVSVSLGMGLDRIAAAVSRVWPTQLPAYLAVVILVAMFFAVLLLAIQRLNKAWIIAAAVIIPLPAVYCSLWLENVTLDANNELYELQQVRKEQKGFRSENDFDAYVYDSKDPYESLPVFRTKAYGVSYPIGHIYQQTSYDLSAPYSGNYVTYFIAEYVDNNVTGEYINTPQGCSIEGLYYRITELTPDNGYSFAECKQVMTSKFGSPVLAEIKNGEDRENFAGSFRSRHVYIYTHIDKANIVIKAHYYAKANIGVADDIEFILGETVRAMNNFKKVDSASLMTDVEAEACRLAKCR